MIETSFRKQCMQRKQQSDRLGQFQNNRVLKDMNGPISESPLMVCVFGYKSQLCHKKTSHQTALNLPILAYTIDHPSITHHLQHLITQDLGDIFLTCFFLTKAHKYHISLDGQLLRHPPHVQTHPPTPRAVRSVRWYSRSSHGSATCGLLIQGFTSCDGWTPLNFLN